MTKRVVTVREAFERYRETVSVLKKGYTQEKSRIDVICRTFLGEMAVFKVRSTHIARYRDHRLGLISAHTRRRLSPSTVRAEIMLLHHFFEICRVEWGYCKDNPCRSARKPEPAAARDRRLSKTESKKILEYAARYRNPNLFAIITVALETAMRQGEIIGLRWEDVNITRRTAHLSETKNGAKRDVPLSIVARDAILRMRELTGGFAGRIFTYSSQNIKQAWKTMVRRLEIVDLHFHDLRHEAISRLFEKDRLDVMEVAAISGHKSLTMLKRYTHLRAENLVKKLDGVRMTGAKRNLAAKLQAYPAVIEQTDGAFRIVFPDFRDLEVFAESEVYAKKEASHLLMRTLLRSILDDTRIPVPGSNKLAAVSGDIILIDPFFST